MGLGYVELFLDFRFWDVGGEVEIQVCGAQEDARDPKARPT